MEGVHETVSVTPAPALQEADPPGPVKVPVYVVVCEGEVEVEPEAPTDPTVGEIVPPVAFVLVHERVEELPCTMEVGLRESVQLGVGFVTVW